YQVEVSRSSYGYDEYHRLLHGTTMHGMQRLDSDPLSVAAFLTPLSATCPFTTAADLVETAEIVLARRTEPLTYFHRTGPVGNVFGSLVTGPDDHRPLAILGLGTGTIASYALPGQPITFYEIDPLAIRIATDPAYFTYMRDCRGKL